MRPASGTERSGAAIGLLLVQLVVGYEWLVSGLTKIVHGDFPAGLGDTVAELAKESSSWYGSFLTGTVVPHANVFAYAIEWAELGAGLVLVATATLALGTGRTRLDRPRTFATVAAVVVGLVLAINFELATGGPFGLHLASDSFDEGVDLDTIMVALQLALLVPALGPLRHRAARPVDRPRARTILGDLIN